LYSRWNKQEFLRFREISSWIDLLCTLKDEEEEEDPLEQAREELLQALTTERKKLQAVLNAIPLGVLIADQTGQICQTNGAVEKIWGFSTPFSHSISGCGDNQGGGPKLDPKKIETDEWALTRAIRKGETTTGEIVQIVRLDGSAGTIRSSALPVRDESGSIIGGVAVVQDITVQGQSGKEQTISHSNADALDFLQTILNAIPTGIFISDVYGQITAKSAMTDRIWGGDAPLSKGIDEYSQYKAWWADTGQAVQPKEYALTRALLHGIETLDNVMDIERFDGTQGTVINSASPIRDKEGMVIGGVSIYQDVTEQRNRERELRRIKDNLEEFVEHKLAELVQFQNSLDNIPDAFSAFDKEWRIVYLNKVAADTLGFPKEQLIGRNFWDVCPKNPVFYEPVNKAMETKTAIFFEAFIQNLGRSYEFKAYPGEDGGLLLYSRDITEQKQMEKEMARLDMLNMIGQIAAGISHEVRNPLTTVRGFLQRFMIKSSYDKDKEIFQLMIDELDRANGIMTEFLSAARMKSADKKMDTLNDIVTSMKPLLEASVLEAGHEIGFEIEDQTPPLNLDEKEIKQLILNLVKNGLEAMRRKGKVTIGIETGDEEVILRVADEGEGISQEALKNLGTPFFTTKATGTGLGLSTCYGIAERHGARIEIQTGTTGTIFLVRFTYGIE